MDTDAVMPYDPPGRPRLDGPRAKQKPQVTASES